MSTSSSEFWLLIVGQLITFLTAMSALIVAMRIRIGNVTLKHELNSRLTEMLVLNKIASRAEGYQEGVIEERLRPRDPSTASDAHAAGLREGIQGERDRPRDSSAASDARAEGKAEGTKEERERPRDLYTKGDQ